jgi:hypothetical protein
MYARGRLDRSVDVPDPDGTDRDAATEGSRRRTRTWAGIFHESIDTLVLGTLSTSMGVVLILVSLRDAIGLDLPIELPLTTYFALIPIGTSIGVIGIVRARVLNRFTSPLSTLGAILCFIPAAPWILGSVGIYLLIMAPFALAFYGSVMLKKLVTWMVPEEAPNDETSDFVVRNRDE